MITKINQFATLVEKETIAHMIKSGVGCQSNINSAKTKVIDGKKYVKVDIGSSGRYMVEKETGLIYGIKAYGVINRVRNYGTLDTINEWYWGDYYAYKQVGVKEESKDLPVPEAKKEEDVVVPVVGMGVTRVFYSDRRPYEVIEVCTPQKIVVRAMNSVPIQGKVCQYDFLSDSEGETITLRKSDGCKTKGMWFASSSKGSYFILGKSAYYHDEGF